MPIENERKFVLSRSFPAEALSGWTRSSLKQAYLDNGPRVRDADGVCTFTYKRWIADAQELVEIETEISSEDFALLWSERTTALNKTRYARRYPSGDWVVDFLRDDSGAVYFVLAEVEMPRGVVSPSSAPEEIASYIVHTVEAADGRFTNKRLTDVQYASALYREISAS